MTRLYYTYKKDKSQKRQTYRIMTRPKKQWNLGVELFYKIPLAENKYEAIQNYYENAEIDGELMIIDEKTTRVLFLGKTKQDTISIPVLKKEDGTYTGVKNVLLL